MSQKKIGIILEVKLEVGRDITSASIKIQKTEDGVAIGHPHTELASANGAPPVAMQALASRIKMDLIESLELFLG